MESFKKGDRVSLRYPSMFGMLKAGDVGMIVEEYDGDQDVFDVMGSKDMEFGRGEFDYGVAFPQLRLFIDRESAPWEQNKVDLTDFHGGDVIPMSHDELILVDSDLREVAE